MPSNYLKIGTWNSICDVCGLKFKSDQLRKRWDGHMVCNEDWEMRHPSDFLRIRTEGPPPPWTRPEKTDTYVTVDYISSSTGNQVTSVPDGTYSPEEPSL